MFICSVMQSQKSRDSIENKIGAGAIPDVLGLNTNSYPSVPSGVQSPEFRKNIDDDRMNVSNMTKRFNKSLNLNHEY
jgi:hypothetical protein